jgi:nitrogen fixation NifU-like protein
MVSEMLEGKSIEQTLNIADDEIANAIDGLPPSKMHCAKLGRELIKSAVDDYQKKQNI